MALQGQVSLFVVPEDAGTYETPRAAARLCQNQDFQDWRDFQDFNSPSSRFSL